MQDSSYITRSDLDTALAQFRDETATLVADVVAEQLRGLGGNGRSTAVAAAPTRTLESDAAQILESIASLKDEVASNQAELRASHSELKADIDGLRKEVKSDIEGLRKEVKSDIEGLRIEVKSDIEGLRTEVKADVGELRRDVKVDVDSLKQDMSELREMRGEVRIIKWMFGLVVAALIAGLTIVHQDLGRRIDGVSTELQASVGALRTEMAELRRSVHQIVERLVRLETLQGLPGDPQGEGENQETPEN